LRPELDQASRKLKVAAGHRRGGRLQERVLIDGERWWRSATVPPHLARVQDALWSDRRLRLLYRRAVDRVVERTVEPYGLVCKAGTWYLLASVSGQSRVYRVSRIEDAELLEETFERATDFDLRAAWTARVRSFRGAPSERASTRVTVRVDPEVSAVFTRVVGEHASFGDHLIRSFPLSIPTDEATSGTTAADTCAVGWPPLTWSMRGTWRPNRRDPLPGQS